MAKYTIENYTSSTECSWMKDDFSDPKNPKCGNCGGRLKLVSSDPQQGDVWHCTKCPHSVHNLPLDPPCGCKSQPCEHTTWDIPKHPMLQERKRNWFEKLLGI